MVFDTIIALATAPIKSALGIIRVSGNDCFDIVSKCCNKDLRNIKERTLMYAKIISGNTIIDEVVLTIFKGPKSFTGEDSIEIMCHGSPLIEQQIIKLLISFGARMATNGEYSSRAFLHGKIDLVQAEAINDLINATTIESKNISMLSLKGDTSSLLVPIKKRIADILSLIEVNIDYPEYEDIEVANKELIIKTVDEINNQITYLIKDGEKSKIVKEGIKVAIVGKPNVGKSSLLNALLNEEKAIVTDIAGTTRDIVEGDVTINGIVLHILDTAGIREADDAVESIGVERAKKSIDEADLVIVVLDADKNNFTNEDKEILDMTSKTNRIVVYNKSDTIKKIEEGKIYISAANKDINSLIKAINENLGIEERIFKQPALNNVRQLGLLKHIAECLNKAKEDAINDLTIDLISVSLMEAYDDVLEILGESNKKDLSKEIFSRFCVGK